jgi:ParB family chromosome partitioning protein
VLLDRLVGEKLKAEAEAIAAEGWKWIEVAVTFPYGHAMGLRELVGTTVDLTDEERATREALRDEYDRLEAEYGEADELPDEVDQRLGEIERPWRLRQPPDGLRSRSDRQGRGLRQHRQRWHLLIERGYVRPEDELREVPQEQPTKTVPMNGDGCAAITAPAIPAR